jgi:hypothetical protein
MSGGDARKRALASVDADRPRSMKRRFLTAYDYGQGAVWTYVLATSEDEITQRFPELAIVDDLPAWMTEEVRATLEAHTEDIDAPGSKLAAMWRGAGVRSGNDESG